MIPLGNELILCTQTYNDTNDFRKFGNTIINSCSVDLRLYMKENYETKFYQMYLKINDNNFQIIPVRINNNNKLVKRFFFYIKLLYGFIKNNESNYSIF